MEQTERGAGARSLSLADRLRSGGYCGFFWREVRLRVDGRFLSAPACSRFKAQVFTFESEGGAWPLAAAEAAPQEGKF